MNKNRNILRKRGRKMATLTVNYKDRFLSLKERAEARKSSKDLRHAPNDNDIRVANENAEDMLYSQQEAIRKSY